MQRPLRALLTILACFASALAPPVSGQSAFIGDPVDVSADFDGTEQVYFIAGRIAEFDIRTGRGLLTWDRHIRTPSLSFNKLDLALGRADASEFPGTEYDRDPMLPFAIDFVSPKTIRLRLATRDVSIDDVPDVQSPMLDGPVGLDDTWEASDEDSIITFTSEFGKVRLKRSPWSIAFLDAEGRILTETVSPGRPASFTPYVPFSFVRRARDLGRSTAAVFSLRHDEKVFGTGESFTRLDKRGQKMVLSLRDAMGAQSRRQYKAAPVFISSAGYGMFLHTSAPVTFDFGHDFDAHTALYSGDEFTDLFVFLGDPATVLSEYTAVTGRSPVPPLWSFGLWMSRITYKSEQELREVARQLRAFRIPTDVIHLDTGWFETDWRSDFRFSKSRFGDPAGMMADLRSLGFRVSLWQLTYFTRKNPLWDEVVGGGYHVRDHGGSLPYLDAVLDFTNPEAVSWYQGRLRGLLELGVGAIKADFGENAPSDGLYHSGRSGWFEHNLYPVRYNRAVFDVTKETTGDGIIWARSAWAGSQRYPVHWGGDAENTNSAMAATLRAGLSIGLSGFTYWSHDIGGFVTRAPRDLYRRWTPFGALTSHTRTHGAPPREPWEYDEDLVSDFRSAMELRYALMPYIYAQAVLSSSRGHPMMRPLFFEFPNDPTSWLIEDQYMFGSDLLVAPLFEEAGQRSVYLPPGRWYDYQSGVAYEGSSWQTVQARPIPIALLVRGGRAIPHAKVAQSTEEIDWSEIELRVHPEDDGRVTGIVALPGEQLQHIVLQSGDEGYHLAGDPLNGRVNWRITLPGTR